MDIGSIRPVIPGMSMPVPRAPAVAEQAAKTDLPLRSAVARTGETAGGGQDAQQASASMAPQTPTLKKTISVDEETKITVFRQIDAVTGDIVKQVPDENRLRLRAMINAWTEAASTAGSTTSNTVA